MWNLRWLLRMYRWARNPPSWQMVMLVFGIIAAALLLYGYEQAFGWPEALTMQGGARPVRP